MNTSREQRTKTISENPQGAHKGRKHTCAGVALRALHDVGVAAGHGHREHLQHTKKGVRNFRAGLTPSIAKMAHRRYFRLADRTVISLFASMLFFTFFSIFHAANGRGSLLYFMFFLRAIVVLVQFFQANIMEDGRGPNKSG